MTKNPFDIVEAFEQAVAEYCGSKYAVAVDSCTNAIFLSLIYWMRQNGFNENSDREIIIPSKTYISPALSIVHAGCLPVFDPAKNNWSGIYQLENTYVYDAAKRFTRGMYKKASLMCLSFHIKKHLKIGKGGMILTDNADAKIFLEKACYHGRSRGVSIHKDPVTFPGWDMYMKPSDAAIGLSLLQNFPDKNPDLPNDYRDLTTFPIFKGCRVIG